MDTAELAAIAAAMCWTVSSLTFGLASRAAGPAAVNQFRLLAALPIMFALHAASTGVWWPDGVTGSRAAMLVASGVLGLAIGDLGYFHALALIGPRLASVVHATWPAQAALLAFAISGEQLRARQALGLAMTTVGVVLVLLRPRDGSAWRPDITRTQRWLGILGAFVAALGQASGMALSRAAMQSDDALPQGIPPLSATVVRLCAGTVGVFAIAALQRQSLAFLSLRAGGAPLRNTLIGTTFGPILGIWLSMVATRDAVDAGSAAGLMSLTPLFLLPVTRIAYGARITALSAAGTLLATAGAVVLVSD